jgi:hypothetical protein
VDPIAGLVVVVKRNSGPFHESNSQHVAIPTELSWLATMI